MEKTGMSILELTFNRFLRLWLSLGFTFIMLEMECDMPGYYWGQLEKLISADMKMMGQSTNLTQ